MKNMNINCEKYNINYEHGPSKLQVKTKIYKNILLKYYQEQYKNIL
jgi:hypothetical protein